MNFGLIGQLRIYEGMLREFAASKQHTLVVASVSGGLAEMASNSGLPFRLATTPEDVLLDSEVDTVILAVEDSEDSLRLARSASQAGKHVVVFPPLNVSPAFSFELHLILDESNHSILPLTSRWMLEDLSTAIPSLSLDRSQVEQVSVEAVVPAVDAETGLKVALHWLDLMAAAGFQYTQVTAIQSLSPNGTLLSQLVTLSSQASADKPAPPAMLTLRHAAGNIDAALLPVMNLHKTDGTSQVVKLNPDFVGLDRIQSLCQDKPACSLWMEAFSEMLELSEAVRKSLKRRRTVDVYFDSGSEKGVFKSQMTAIGCGVLTYMFFGMIAYLIVAQLVSPPDWLLHVARILWITPLVIFLLAQALLPLARDRSASK